MNLLRAKGSAKDFCLLVEDHPKQREHLESVIEQVFPSLERLVTRGFHETASLLRASSATDIRMRYALVDVGLPDGSGIDLIKIIHEKDPSIRVIISTIFCEDSTILKALATGAYGYILKSEGEEVYRETLRRLARDEPPISPRIARRILSHFQMSKTESEDEASLTPREKQTLTHLVDGLTVQETATCMGISAQTVSGYVKIIYQKLQVSNRAEVTREAIRRRII